MKLIKIIYTKILNYLADLLRTGGRYQQAEPLYRRAMEIDRRVLGEDHPSFATSLNNLALLYWSMGRYEESEPLYNQAKEIRRRVLGENHSDYATSLHNLAALYNSMGRYEQAEPLYCQAIEIDRRVMGEDHRSFANNLNSLAVLYYSMGRYEESEPLYRQAMEIQRRVLGENHADYARSLRNLSNLYLFMGRHEECERLYRQAIEIDRRTLGENHPNFASSLHSLAALYDSMGRYEDAEPLYRQAREIQRQVLGENHPEYASSLNDLALLYKAMGRYEHAEPLLLQAKEIRDRVLGEDHPDYATSLNNLASLYESMGRYEECEPLHHQAIETRCRVLGENHPYYARSLNTLAKLYGSMGRYEEAEPLYRQAMEIQRRVLGEDHPDYAASLNNLVRLYHSMGRSEECESFCLQTIEFSLRVLGENHPYYATCLNNLAELYKSMRRYEECEPLYRQANEIWRRALGENHPDYATSLNNLANLYHSMGRYEECEPLHHQAIEIRRRVLGENHPYYAQSLNNLAALYYAMGRYDECEPLHHQAIETRRRVLGGDHPDYADSLINLASHFATTARYSQAFEAMQQGVAIQNRLLARIAGVFPEQQILAFGKTIETSTDEFLTLIWRHFSQDETAVKTALDLLLGRKAMAYEAATVQHQAALAGASPKLMDAFSQLSRVRSELARRSLSGPAQGESRQQHQARIDTLEQERQQLERQLAKHVPEITLQQRLLQADRNAVAEALPTGALLVEFFRFHPYRFEATGSEPRWAPARYIAFNLKEGVPEHIEFIDLGDAEKIDRRIAEFRAAMDSEEAFRAIADEGADNGYKSVCRSLYDCLFVPLAEHTGAKENGLSHIVIAADGELCQLPFEALLSPEQRYLVQDYLISYVTVGREVVRFDEGRLQTGGAVIIADPDYDLVATTPLEPTDDVPNEAVSVGREGAFEHTGMLRQLRRNIVGVNRLPATREEGETVKRLLQEKGMAVSSFWLEGEALERRFKAVNKPTILHVATHGFFLPDSNRSVREQFTDLLGTRSVSAADMLGGAGYIESPLLRSGLVFAGFNSMLQGRAVPEDAEDGVVNALDLLTMDLMGTGLMVLSACQTGLGVLKRGEGVMGLRRSCMMAGVHTLVMSLWPVPDDETQQLMSGFYKNMLGGTAKADSLRKAQLDMIDQLTRVYGEAHPFLWAGFICQGDPSPLSEATSVHESNSKGEE